MEMSTTSMLPIIQLAITPVILISGMGGLMIAITNRMGRIVDRTRILAGQVRAASSPEEREPLDHQLDIMFRRAHLIRLAVTFNGLSMLVACLLIVSIFLDAFTGRSLALLMVGLFAASIGLLVAALVAFLKDINVSLAALELEVGRSRKKSK